MDKIKVIRSVNRFAVNEKQLCLVDNNIIKIISCDGEEELQKYSFEERMQDVYMNSSYIWSNSNSGQGFYFSEKDLFKNGNYILLITNESQLYQYLEEGVSKKNLLNGEIVWKIPISDLLVEETDYAFYIRTNPAGVASYNPLTGKKNWDFYIENKYDYTSFFTSDSLKKSNLTRIVGSVNNIIWIALSSGRLLGLHEQTGEILYNIINPTHTPGEYNLRNENEYLHYGLHMNVDKERNMLFGLNGHYYFEIDLSDPVGSYTMYDVKDALMKAGFSEVNVSGNGYKHTWKGDEIFFGERDTQGPSVGIFNRRNKTITWTYTLPATESYLANVQKIDYASNKLYVLDGNRTLHIFKNNT